jgi:Bacterial EndoU nuclease
MVSKIINRLKYFICFTVLISLFVLNLSPTTAWAQASYKGTFKLTKACDATTSIRGRNPVHLTVDQTYEVTGLNKDDNATHAYIKVPGFGSRWVALKCGTLGNGTSPIPTNNSQFLPFFDNINNPINVAVGGKQDITPPPPTLSEFDLAVNELCGKPGTAVDPGDFQAMINQFPDVLANIKTTVGGSITAGNTSDPDFIDDLTNLWFKTEGFDHIFCGEATGNSIGGLHFVGRYLDLQNKGLAGRLPGADSKAEVEPGAVYTLGAVMQVGNRKIQSPVKGYGYTLNAEDILAITTKAYKDNPHSGTSTKACLLSVTDDGKTFDTVFVTKENSIRTIYPDATPDYKGTSACNG